MSIFTDLAVINDAIVRVGAQPLASLADQTAQALSAQQIYDGVRQNLLAAHPWTFALRLERISSIVVPPADRRWTYFEHVYQLPPDCLRVLGLRDGGPYQIAGDQLYTDCPDAELVYIKDVPVSAWAPYFRQLVVLELAAAFAIPLTDSSSRSDIYFREAQQQRRIAMTIDSQQVPPWVFDLMRIYTRPTYNPLATA